MKRGLIVMAAVAGVVVLGLAGLLLFTRSEPPTTGLVDCPIYVSRPLAERLGLGSRPEPWEIYSYEGEGGTARVKVEPSSTVPPGGVSRSCRLKILWAPEKPGKASDWRIGQVFRNHERLRGRVVTFRVLMKGSTEFRFDTAQIYIYDGVKVDGAPIKRVTPDWEVIRASTRLDPGATTFQVWVRLLLDRGTVRPGSGQLFFIANVEE